MRIGGVGITSHDPFVRFCGKCNKRYEEGHICTTEEASMPRLDEPWSQSDKDALDRHITGNWGEDGIPWTPFEPEEEYDPNDDQPRRVYIAESEYELGRFNLLDAYTDWILNSAPRTRTELVAYATEESWEIVEGHLYQDVDYEDDRPSEDVA